jgi:hypothetical protein
MPTGHFRARLEIVPSLWDWCVLASITPFKSQRIAAATVLSFRDALQSPSASRPRGSEVKDRFRLQFGGAVRTGEHHISTPERFIFFVSASSLIEPLGSPDLITDGIEYSIAIRAGDGSFLHGPKVYPGSRFGRQQK